MSRIKPIPNNDGFFAIGLINNVDELNVGTLWRSAFILGASYIFTVGKKYRTQGSDVTSAWTKIPLFHYETVDQLKENLPFSTRLIAVELDDNATPLSDFFHPDRAVYLLGNEQIGLPPKIMKQCHATVSLPGTYSLNVAVAGSIVMYDRSSKLRTSDATKNTPMEIH